MRLQQATDPDQSETETHAETPQGETRQDKGFNDLAVKALAKLCEDIWPGAAASTAVVEVMGNPMAATMAHALCDADEMAAFDLVDELLAAGLSVEEVCLKHLAPAARRLGDLWMRDRLPFTEVTFAAGRIQAILRRMPTNRVLWGGAPLRSALFAAVPGEQHTVGVVMAADLFRRHGWDIGLLAGLDHDTLMDSIAGDDRPFLGLSCSGSHSFEGLCKVMISLRKVRPQAFVLLAGNVIEVPELMAALPYSVTLVRDVPHAEQVMARITAGASRSVQGTISDAGGNVNSSVA